MEIGKVIRLLKLGEIGVVPTDTIYGIVGSALNPQVVERIYKLRKRSTEKPMIILISEISDLKKFNIRLTLKQINFLEKTWPNPISVVLPNYLEKFKYLHRGKNSLAFRMPKKEMLLQIIHEVGPLVAPSANYEGEQPSQIIKDAKGYFGKQVAFYIDEGEIKSEPSTIIELSKDGQPTVLRDGIFKLG